MRIINKKNKEKESQDAELLWKYDEYRNGFGWWKSLDVQAKIMARTEAWRKIGIHGGPASWLGHYDRTPQELVGLVCDQNIKIISVGPKTIARMGELTSEEYQEWEREYSRLYDNKDSWIYCYCKELPGWKKAGGITCHTEG